MCGQSRMVNMCLEGKLSLKVEKKHTHTHGKISPKSKTLTNYNRFISCIKQLTSIRTQWIKCAIDTTSTIGRVAKYWIKKNYWLEFASDIVDRQCVYVAVSRYCQVDSDIQSLYVCVLFM